MSPMSSVTTQETKEIRHSLELKRRKDKGMDIKEIGVFGVSPEGEKILPKFGFAYLGEKVS